MRKIKIRGNLFLLMITFVSVGFGICCRLDGLSRESLWIDEIDPARRVAIPTLRGLLSKLVGTPLPPLDHVILWICFRLWGSGDPALRGLAATCGLLAIPTTSLLATSNLDTSRCRRLFRGEIFADPYQMIPSPISRRLVEIWECGRPDGEGAAHAR